LAGLFPVTPALANGVIFTLVSPKVDFFVITIDDVLFKNPH
jgi:hypothetical protein